LWTQRTNGNQCCDPQLPQKHSCNGYLSGQLPLLGDSDVTSGLAQDLAEKQKQLLAAQEDLKEAAKDFAAKQKELQETSAKVRGEKRELKAEQAKFAPSQTRPLRATQLRNAKLPIPGPGQREQAACQSFYL
jgi:uncharacterized protein (DUF3084 family)